MSELLDKLAAVWATMPKPPPAQVVLCGSLAHLHEHYPVKKGGPADVFCCIPVVVRGYLDPTFIALVDERFLERLDKHYERFEQVP